LTIYIPEPTTILLIVLSFLAGFLYKRYRDNEDVADAFDEGFEKGAEAAINTVSRVTGRNIADELYGEVLDRRSSR
tara:strand:- start:94 stop:321 length:228 start_codon:yes stop_codon:yes gene_type:complete